MIPTLKSEFRKLLTVRSTYFITGLVVLLVCFIAFYIVGWRSSGATLQDPTLLAGDVLGGLNVTVFGAIVAILLMTHEYRYNTIMYTLTASNSRSRVILSKIIVVSAYALLLAVIVGVLSPVMGYLGVHLHGRFLAPQTMHLGNLAWRSLFYSWGYGMAGLLVAVLLRSQVAAIAALFLIPDLAEQLLSLLLKGNAIYLPFSALNQVIRSGVERAGSGELEPAKAAWVFLVYLVVGWAVAWVLFLRRDAN